MRNAFLVFFICISKLLLSKAEEIIVNTNNGKVTGKYENIHGADVTVFRKIPYAEPPLAELRLKDPVPVKNWNDVKGQNDITECVQPKISKFGNVTIAGQEDCLYLNVFTTAKNFANDKLAVLFYIHGGGFFMNSAKDADRSVLLQENIIVVAINYRLGILGFLSTEDEAIPGNFGMKDQSLALKWVKENIHHFGGDSSKITVSGNSGGSASAHMHLFTPYSKGLFRGAILQSGSVLFNRQAEKSGDHKNKALQIAGYFKCFLPEGQEQTKKLLKCLQNVDALEITSLFLRYGAEWAMDIMMSFGPRIDRKYFPDTYENLLKEKQCSKVSILHGITTDDGAFILKDLDNKPSLNFYEKNPEHAMQTILFKVNAPNGIEISKKIFQYYFGDKNINTLRGNYDEAEQLFTKEYFQGPHNKISQMHEIVNRGTGHKIYQYEFSYIGQRSIKKYFPNELLKNKVVHVDDLLLLYEVAHHGPESDRSEDDVKMSNIMAKLWANFVKYGDPTPDESLGYKWITSSETKINILNLNHKPQMMDEYSLKKRTELRELFPEEVALIKKSLKDEL